MTDHPDETRREISYALFGNRAVIDVVNAIVRLTPASEDFVTTRRVAAVTGLSDSVVRPVMRRLVAAGLLIDLPRGPRMRGEHFHRAPHGPLRDALATLCELIASQTAEADKEHTPTQRRRRR